MSKADGLDGRLRERYAALPGEEALVAMLLPFEIRRPDRVGADWRLVGGRYRSIAERLDGEHRGIDGVDVELRAERGPFYAMAGSAS